MFTQIDNPFDSSEVFAVMFTQIDNPFDSSEVFAVMFTQIDNPFDSSEVFAVTFTQIDNPVDSSEVFPVKFTQIDNPLDSSEVFFIISIPYLFMVFYGIILLFYLSLFNILSLIYTFHVPVVVLMKGNLFYANRHWLISADYS
jgi:hypothetical protein